MSARAGKTTSVRRAESAAGRDLELPRDFCAARRVLPIVVALFLLAVAVMSSAAAAETNKAPKVIKQPVSATVEEGQSASFITTASGTPTPTVQWEVSTNAGVSWSPIGGATAGTLTIASTGLSESGSQFRAVYKNGVLPDATSKAATLTVQTAPAVTKQPLSLTVEEGQNAVFEASASGSPAPTIKWETSANGGATWTPVVGGTSNPLTIVGAKTSVSGHEYRATFTNAVSKATSEAATLTVQKFPSVTKQPASLTVDEGQSAVFEATGSGFPTPTVQWEVSADGGSTWSVVEGATSSQLTIASTLVSEDGREYRAVFTNAAGSVASQSATLTVHAPPVVTQQPAGITVEVGESAVFEAAASGYPTPTVQWETSTNAGKTWSAISGATADQLAVENAQASETGDEYRAVFTNAAGITTTNEATLTVATNHFGAVAWGDNLYHQLGGFEGPFSDAPAPVTGLKFVTAVAAGEHHSMALLANGTVVAWGAGGFGQLGDGGTAESDVPVAVEGLSGVKAIAAGADHSLALLANGTVMAWGDNESGQLGIGATPERAYSPVAVKGLTGVKAISAGANYSLALLTNGTVMAWGENESGQLGSGDLNNRATPTPVKLLTGVAAISAGYEFSLALLASGTVKAWGNDGQGQLGNTTLEEEGEGNSDRPVAVENLTGVQAIAAGSNHGLALLSGGTVVGWGDDTFGELGNGTNKPSHTATPVAVSGLSGVTTISAGREDSAALLASGSLMTWGSDASGALGDGSASGMSDVPVAVVGLTKVASISAGRDDMLAYGEPIPAVTSVSPSIGPATGGETVTIGGSTFSGATAVKFGTADASFAVDSATSITATVPPGSGTVDVTVITPAGTSPPIAADRYTYERLPTITKLSAKSGPSVGRTLVTITGTEFTAASKVAFGGTSAVEFTVNSPTSITVVAPPAAAGTVDVNVTNVAGTSASSSKDRFKYVPAVEGVTPNAGSTLGNESVTVTGSGFALGSSATAFKFGKVKAKSVNCTSSTSCIVTTPAQAAGTVDVTATVNKAASTVDAGDHFTYS